MNTNEQVGDRGVRALAESRELRRLEHLDLVATGMSDFGVIAIAESAHMASLKVLVLGFEDTSDDTADALIASPHLNQLEYLSLGKLSREGRKALKKRFGAALTFV